MHRLPDGFDDRLLRIRREAMRVQGWLKPCEIDFLALLAACPTAAGRVLEIGCYHGKSTVVLALAAELVGERVTTVDPLEITGALAAFRENVARARVGDRVELRQMTSARLAADWQAPLRLLWIDGDHSYEGKKLDAEGFFPHLADGGVVAFHDVLHRFEGPVRTYIENVLLSPHFAAVGLCGSIGWGQYRADPASCRSFEGRKLALFRRLARLVPTVAYARRPTRWNRWKHDVFRAAVPHGAISPRQWLREVA